MSLEPIDPETALELYLADKENDLATASLEAHEYRLNHFVGWSADNDIENLNTLTGRQLHRYRIWRREDGNLSPASEKTQMDTLRVFIRWLESVDGVEQDLSKKVLSPSITADQNTRDVMLDADHAKEILDHLRKYEYATVSHVTLALMWHTMMRIGAVYALNVEDYDPDDQSLEVHHRPETGTPIKNQGDGERFVALSEKVCTLLDDWIETKRPAVKDDYNRRPLVSSDQGRLAKSALRKYVYIWTRPCAIGDVCPEDRDPETCDAADYGCASQCPESVSPHAIRRGSITYSLNNDIPKNVVSDRANVSPEILDQHYDRRSEREKMEQRREYIDSL